MSSLFSLLYRSRETPTTHQQLASPGYPTFRDWPRLPTELKIKILTLALTELSNVTSFAGIKSIGPTEHRHAMSKTLLPLIGTANRELALLAQQIYYENNTFRVFCESKEGISAILYPNPLRGHWVRRLNFDAGSYEIGVSLEQALVDVNSVWYRLIRPKGALEDKALDSSYRSEHILANNRRTTEWQTAFPHLQRLDVVVDAQVRNKDGIFCQECIGEKNIEALRAMLADAEILLKAEHVHVTVNSFGCEQNEFDGYPACSCQDGIAAIFGEMMRKGSG